MGEVVNVIVAFALIVFLFRWVTSPGHDSAAERSAVQTLGFRPKRVTQEMVDTIHGMFPNIPKDNIHYDLLRTGNIELTSNKILEKGYLDAPPPPYYTLFPRASTSINPSTPQNSNSTFISPTPKTPESLIVRYHLHDRIPTSSAISSPPQLPEADTGMGGGRAVWENSSERREASLRERKAQMILAARQRLLAQQSQASISTSSNNS